MTLVPAAAILVARRDAPVRARSSPTWRSRTSAAPACGSRCSRSPTRGDRRSAPAAAGRRHADARRGRRAGRLRDQGGAGAAALVAAARAPGRAGAPLGADVGRDDQGRAVRADPRAVRVARRDAALARHRAAGARAAVGARRRAVGARAARPQAAAGVPLDRERRDHRARTRRLAAARRRAARASGRRSRSRRRCCTWPTTRSSRRCCSSAPARSSARSARSSSTGSAGCCAGCRGRAGRSWSGSMAIAGLPPLNGFASEWLTLQALLHVALDAAGRRGARRRARARRRWRRRPRWRCCASSRSSGSCCSGAPRRPECATAVEAPAGHARRRWRRSRCCACVIGVVPGLIVPTLAGLAPGASDDVLPRHAGLTVPGTGSLPALGLAVALVALGAALVLAARDAARGAGADVGVRAAVSPALQLDVGRLHQAAAAGARGRAAPAPRGRGRRASGGLVQRVTYSSEIPSLADAQLYEPAIRAGLRGAERRAPPADRQRPHVRALPAGARPRPARAGPHRSPRMSSLAAGVLQLAGVALAPLLPGTIQSAQGAPAGAPRRVAAAALPRSCGGCGARAPSTPRAPGRSTASPRRWSPRACSSRFALVPLGGRAGGLGARPRRARAGRRAGARRASRVAAAAWDTGNGFALMGAARDLTFAVFGEALLVLALLRRRAAGAQHRPARDERRRGAARASGASRRTGAARWPSRSWCSSRPAASRSTTPTPTSS